jgi:uncharacterized protein YyaL (SSP411 family)
MSNRLAQEKSPYLLQHAENPVDWYPWGEEAFEKARREDKPIFLSVGYSTCHWCHVMAHESFEDPAMAAVMNDLFVNIKVDREERPDVDRLNMAFVQATNGHGGWPMSVWLTPDLKPFYGGTYFPPDDNRLGRPGFGTVCRHVSEVWKTRRQEVLDQCVNVLALLEQNVSHTTLGGDLPGEEELLGAYRYLAENFDNEWGGFGRAPKFPRPTVLQLLFRLADRGAEGSPVAVESLRMALLTLRTMADGGTHDHVGGGFHRYSVDTYWHVPHFEKMLYDQAQLVLAYLEAYQITRDPWFADVARFTLDYVQREMTHAAGGFYSAEDADSFATKKADHAVEGAFYVWTWEELEKWLGSKAALYAAVYDVKPGGNAPRGSDPQGEFTGQNILFRRLNVEEAAVKFQMTEEEVTESLGKCGKILFTARSQRPRPHLDDKIITAWNGLMISAFARAAWVLNDKGYRRSAEKAAEFLRKELWDGTTLLRNYREGAGRVHGFAEDYAFLIQGLLDLFQLTGEPEWAEWARTLQGRMDAQFGDEISGGYFSSPEEDPHLVLRLKEDYDGAEPSPNSVAALNLFRLEQLWNEPRYGELARNILKAFSRTASRSPQAVPLMMVAVDQSLRKPRQVVFVGKPESPEYRALLAEVRLRFLPDTQILQVNPAARSKALEEANPFLREVALAPAPAVYVCENFTCQLPVRTPEELAKILDQPKPVPAI